MGSGQVAYPARVPNTDGFIVLPLSSFLAASGSWTRSRQGNAIHRLRRLAALTTEVVSLDVRFDSRTTSNRGRKITGAKIQYRVSVEVADDVTVSGFYNGVPADTVALAAGTSLGNVSYDAGHDTAGERGAIAQHTMTVTFASPVFLNDVGTLELLVTVNDSTGGGAVFDLFQVVLLTADALGG